MKKLSAIVIFIALAFTMSAQLTMQNKNEGILITENGENVLFFQVEPKSLDGKYERCNYIHPLWSHDGTILTEDFPADHYHHRGIFWTWHQVWIGEKRIGDPWEIKDFEQDVIEVEFIKQADGSVLLKTEVEWKSDKWKKNGKKVPYMNEKAKINIHPKNGKYRKIDFEIALLALEENLKIGGSEDDKGYSGFSVRMKLPDDVKFEGVNGNVEPTRTALESPGFINASGSLLDNDGKAGIVMIDHPDNPDYPQKWILRARNSMQNAAWPGNKAVPVSNSEPLVLKYSLVVYEGQLNSKRIQKIIK